jgi:hypothetical protein
VLARRGREIGFERSGVQTGLVFAPSIADAAAIAEQIVP